jgi:pimeloyl-ACP methyl ester carboxylesterase
MGLGIDHSGWGHLVPTLCQSYECISYDHRGTGRSDAPPGPYTISQLADDAAALLDVLDLGPVHVCGASLGGAIGMRLAAERPDLVRTLALHSTMQKTDGLLAAIMGFRRPILEALGPAALRRYIEFWTFTSDHWATGEGGDRFEDLYETAHDDVHLDTWLAHLEAAIAHDCESDLERISAPTLVVVGDEDILTPLRFARVMAATIPDARLHVLEHAAHGYFFETPQRFLDLQLEFLANAPR